MRTLAKDFTARAHKECVNICAHLHAQMCTRSLCVRAVKTLASVRMRAYHAASIKKAHAASIKKTHASVHTCAHWSESSLLIHTKNVCTCVHASVRMCMCTHSLCVRAVKTLVSVCTCARTGQSLHCSYTQRMCAHVCILACTNVHTFFVCTSSEDSGQCAHACIPRSVHKEGPCSVHKEGPCKCAHVRTLARVFTAHTHKECMHMCACKCSHVCAHILCVYEQ